MEHQDAIILIPTYEPEDTLLPLLESLQKEKYTTLVVNDGSKKEFDSIFDQAKKYATVVGYPKNHGKGYALKYGIRKIQELFPQARYLITADSDGQHSVKDIGRTYDKLKETDNVVIGVRLFDKNVPFKSKVGNSFSKITRSLATKEYIPDDQCGLRGFPQRFFNKLLKVRGRKYDYEMNALMLMQLRHYPISYLEVETIYLNNNKASHFAPFKDTFRIQATIFSHSLVSLASIICMIASFILLNLYAKVVPQILDYLLAELVGFQIMFAFMSAIYPTLHTGYRLRKELFYFVIRIVFGTALFSLLFYGFHLMPIWSAIISFFAPEVLNVLVPRFIVKHFYHNHN